MTIPSSTGVKITSTSSGRNLSASSTLSAELPSLSSYSTCVTNCLQLSIADENFSSVADVNCFCPRTEFTTGLTVRVIPLFPNELPTAETLAQSFCTLASTSTSLAFSVTSMSSFSSSLTSTSLSETATLSSASSTVSNPASSGSSNAALGGTKAAWGTFAAIFGVVVSRMAMH
ncbi:hypothetical protein EDD85DRAFT_947776 [Armillaria nabsnona]|nr:hypothetical protein EDD85DRAFT_947776 [Armillaria nabsnona]